MTSTPPSDVTDAKPIVAEQVKPKKKPKKTPAAPVPVSVASAAVVPVSPSIDAPPAEAVKLGALGSGEDTSPKQQQEVASKIAGIEKRLTDLPGTIQDQEQKQIAKVKLFNKEASDALKSGDVDGARILATKAELLLDDLNK